MSGDGKTIVSGSDEKTVRVWNAQSGEVHDVVQGGNFHEVTLALLHCFFRDFILVTFRSPLRLSRFLGRPNMARLFPSGLCLPSNSKDRPIMLFSFLKTSMTASTSLPAGRLRTASCAGVSFLSDRFASSLILLVSPVWTRQCISLRNELVVFSSFLSIINVFVMECWSHTRLVTVPPLSPQSQ